MDISDSFDMVSENGVRFQSFWITYPSTLGGGTMKIRRMFFERDFFPCIQ